MGAPDSFFGETVPGRRGEILDAALRVFGVVGYAGGSMRRIAEEVGISEPALYRHFGGKEDLFLTLIEHSGERIRREVSPALGDARPDNLRETVRTLLESRWSEVWAHHLPLLQTILAAAAHNPMFLDAYRHCIVDPLADELAALVPRLDEHFKTTSTPAHTAQRIRALMSLFVGYFAMSDVLAQESVDIGGAVMRIMGWGDS